MSAGSFPVRHICVQMFPVEGTLFDRSSLVLVPESLLLWLAPSIPLDKALFIGWMYLYLRWVFRGKKVSSVSPNLITFQNYSVLGCLCQFPAWFLMGGQCGGCFDVGWGFFSSFCSILQTSWQFDVHCSLLWLSSMFGNTVINALVFK